MELKLGIGGGDGLTRFENILSKRPDQRSKVIQRSSCYRNTLWTPILVGRPDKWVMHCWGQMSCRGQPGSTRGQIAQECPMATRFGRKNPWPKSNALLGSKVLQVSIGVNQGENCIGMPYGYQCRGQLRSTRCQIAQENLMATKFGRKNPDPKMIHCWGQRSAGSQIA